MSYHSKAKRTQRQKSESHLDYLVSKCVRLETPYCVICGSTWNLENGHLITRGARSLRWNEKNCNTQCHRCNRYHEINQKPYIEWFIKKHGQAEYDALVRLGNMYMKFYETDRQDMIRFWKKKLKHLQTNPNLI